MQLSTLGAVRSRVWPSGLRSTFAGHPECPRQTPTHDFVSEIFFRRLRLRPPRRLVFLCTYSTSNSTSHPTSSTAHRRLPRSCKRSRKMESALFYHLVFPPKLPQREDANLDEIESALVAHLIAAARSMIQTSAGGELGLQRASSAWESLERCLRATRSVNRHGGVNKTRMLAEMRSMTACDTLIIHVRSQNAGIIVHRLIKSVLSRPLHSGYMWLTT